MSLYDYQGWGVGILYPQSNFTNNVRGEKEKLLWTKGQKFSIIISYDYCARVTNIFKILPL